MECMACKDIICQKKIRGKNRFLKKSILDLQHFFALHIRFNVCRPVNNVFQSIQKYCLYTIKLRTAQSWRRSSEGRENSVLHSGGYHKNDAENFVRGPFGVYEKS